MGSGRGSIPILTLTPICLVANLPIENYNHNHFSTFQVSCIVFQPQTLRHQSSSGWCVCLVAKLCPTLCDPMDCSPTVHGISQARVLEWVAISFSSGSSQPRDGTHVSCIAGESFTAEPLGKPQAGGMHTNITMKMILFKCVSLSMVTGHTHKHCLNQPRLPF